MEKEIKDLCKVWGFDDFKTLGELDGAIIHQPIYLDQKKHLDGVPLYVEQKKNKIKIISDSSFKITAHFFGDD